MISKKEAIRSVIGPDADDALLEHLLRSTGMDVQSAIEAYFDAGPSLSILALSPLSCIRHRGLYLFWQRFLSVSILPVFPPIRPPLPCRISTRLHFDEGMSRVGGVGSMIGHVLGWGCGFYDWACLGLGVWVL
jgi:hypothetical protein